MQWSSGPVKVARKPTTTHQRRKVIPPLLPYPDMEKIHSSQRGGFLRMTASPHSASQPVEAVELSEETLRVLRQQRSLSLCGRQILSIRHIRHLEYMINLQSLNMHMNLLRQVDGLATLRQLVELDLSANELQTLGETNCFDGLIQLRRLNLSSNLLRTIHANVWLPLTSLEWLSLGFNLLEDISGLCTLPSQLQYVDVCGNCLDNLDHVEKALAPHRQSLRELRISNPQLAATGIFPFVASNANTSSGLLRENPCCDWISPTGESCAERLLAVFDRLTALNGVVVGVDALAEVLSAVEVGVPSHSHASIPRDEISASEWVPAAAVAASPKQHSPVAAAVRRRSSETKDRQGKHKHRGRTPGVDWSRSIQHVTPSPTCSRTSSRLRVATPPNTLVGATPTRPPSSRVDRAAAAQAVVRTPLGIDASIGSATERVPGRKVSIAVGTDERPVGPLFTPKCVSRRVNTEVSLMGAVDVGQSATNSSRGTPPEASVVLAVEDLSSVESVTDHIQHQEVEMLELRVKRMSEQLLLRIAMEEDLRRTLQLSQQRSQSDLAAQESRVYQLQTQVMALKDEMTRKAQEVAIMNRKNKAEMEWQAQRLSAQHAAELGKKNAALAEMSAANDKMVASHSRRCQEVQDEAAQLRERQTELLSRVNAALLEVDVQSRATAHANMRTKAAQHALQVQRLEYDELRSRSCLWQENLIPMLHMTIHFWKSRWLSSNREHHKQLISWQQNQQTWEEYAVSQQTQYTDAIQHAQQEAERWYSALQAVQAEALFKQQVVHAETQTRDAEASEDDSTVADLRLMCECLKSEVTRLRESSTLVEAAHTRLAEENTRLLARIEERRGDECTNHERENFLRTIRNLEKDIQNKDSSLAELEAEAHAKLDSKRERIAALENQVEDLLSRVEKATESSVKYRDQLDALERSSAPSRDEVARWKGQYERLCEEYKKQESRVMMQEEQLTTLRSRESTLLGERTTLVSALSRARDQLVQEHAAHASVLSQHQCCAVALAKKDADLAELKRSYEAALSTSRAKHRAALSALSQLMEGDEVAT